MRVSFSEDQIRAEARAYGEECNAENRLVNIGDFCERLGMNRQWLSSGHSERADSMRIVVLQEWVRLNVTAHHALEGALKEIKKVMGERVPVISESEWPAIEDLRDILAMGQRRAMFEDLRNRYGRAVAMRYAYVCDHPQAYGSSTVNVGSEAS
jgi:hypothetical protein